MKKSETKLRVACEISSDRVVAAQAGEGLGSIRGCTIRALAPGVLTPTLTATNVGDRDALVTAVSDVLDGVGTKERDIIAVIPDAACRIALLDFDSLPDKSQDADAVVRFRLKKSLPFDVERARLSYDVRANNGNVQVVAVVAVPSIVEEYESVLRSAGFSPGVVIPSTLAALQIVHGSRPTLVLKIASNSVSLAILYEDALRLFRTLEGEPANPAQLAEDIYPSFVFFEDTYGAKIESLIIDGPGTKELAPAMEESTGIRVHELVDASMAGGTVPGTQRPYVGGILGALIS